jgi:hypothetical protein
MIYEISERNGTLFVKEHDVPLSAAFKPSGDYIVVGESSCFRRLNIFGKKYKIVEAGGLIHRFSGLKYVDKPEPFKNKYFIEECDWVIKDGCRVVHENLFKNCYHNIPKANWWTKSWDHEYIDRQSVEYRYPRKRKYVSKVFEEVEIRTSVYVMEKNV